MTVQAGLYMTWSEPKLFVFSRTGSFILQYQIKRLEQEKENLSKQIEWLNKEVNDKSKELMTLRREKVCFWLLK